MLHLLETETSGALCLDGTPGGVYYQKGYGSGKRKTIAYFEGGGWCGGRDQESLIADCYGRSSTDLGSSSKWALTDEMGWIISNYQSGDLTFYNWNKFIFKYCDGSGHQGTIKEPQVYNGKNVWFRGVNVTLAQFAFLESLIPYEETDEFVLTGCSAGGLATYTWADYVKNQIASKNTNTKYFAMPDSGFFLDYKNQAVGDNDYTIRMGILYDLVNKETPYPNQACVHNNPIQPELCFLTQNMIKYIESPLFMIESLYDTW